MVPVHGHAACCKTLLVLISFVRDYNFATPGVWADMEAIEDSHAVIRSRRCQFKTSTLSKEGSNEQTQFNHN